MKSVLLKTTLSCIVCALLALTASAQSDPTTSSGTQSGQSSQPGMSGSSTTSSMSGKQSLRASKQLMNASVKDQTGQNLGNIEDLIVNPQSGRVEFAVLSVGGKLHPVPFQLLTPSSTGATTGTTTGTSQTTFTANVERQKIEQSPSIERAQWPAISKDWTQQIYSHYGVQPEAMGSPGSGSQGGQQGGAGQETTPPTPSR